MSEKKPAESSAAAARGAEAEELAELRELLTLMRRYLPDEFAPAYRHVAAQAEYLERKLREAK